MDDAVEQFCAVTAAEPELARQYLEVADGNLESAITLFLESGGASIESQRHAAESRGSSTDTPGDEEMSRRLQEEEYGSGMQSQQEGEQVRERIQPVTERLVEPQYGMGGFGLGGAMGGAVGWRSSGNRINTPIGIFNQAPPRNIFEDEDEDMDEDEDDILEQTVGTTRLTAHQSRLANLFRPPFDLISNLSLERAKQEAHAAKKWLLVNIQDSREFACQQLNRDLWSNAQVKECVGQYFIFLQYQHDSAAGLDYLQFYPFSEFPHIAVLDPITGEQLKVWSQALSPEQFLEEAHEFLAQYSLEPGHKNPPSKISRNKTNPEHMTEEEQIEFALRQSLGKREDESDDDDFVSVSSRQGIEDIDDEIEIKEIPGPSRGTKEAPVQIDIDDELPLTEEDKFATIMPHVSEEPTDPNTSTRIQIRLGDGSRIIRRFQLSDPVRLIYSFIKSQVESVHGHYFSLSSERKNLLDSIDQTIEEAHLKNSVVLVEILD
jgi:UBX domain-containing protein 7